MSCIKPEKFSEYEDVVTEYLIEKEGISKEKAERIAYNDWKELVLENSSMTEAKVFTQIGNDDGSIDVRFNGTIKPTRMKLVSVSNTEYGYDVSLQNTSSKKVSTYSFQYGQSRSKDKRFIKKDESEGKTFVDISNMGNVFGSSDDTNINKELYEKQELDVLNNIENSITLLNKLKDIDGESVSDIHYVRLNTILKMFVDSHKQLIPQMNVYINKQAEKVGGILQVDDGIYLGINDTDRVVSTDISNSEMYVEEITHAATIFALKTGDVKAQSAKTRIQQLRNQVREEFRKEYGNDMWKVFLPKESIDKKYEEDQAKKMFDYIFNNEKTGLEEFIAKGLTWEIFAEKLDQIKVKNVKEQEPDTIFQTLIFYLNKLFNIAKTFYTKENLNTTATDVLVRMSAQLAEANNKAIKQTDDKKFITNTVEKVDNFDKKLSDWAQKFLSGRKDVENLPSIPKEGSGTLSYIKYLGQILPYLIGTKEGQIAVKELMYALGLKYGGDIQTFFSQLTDPDNMARAVEYLGLLNENVDRSRETRAKLTALGIAEGFKKFSKKEKEALTLAGLDIDIQAIYDDYDAAILLENNKELEKALTDIRKKLRAKAEDVKTSNYYIAQAKGLGFYMATHQGKSVAQLMNANLIAKGHNRIESRKTPDVDKEIIKLIDQLATLEGMLYTPQEAKSTLAELIKREPDGMKYVIHLSKGIIEETKMKTFENELGMMKGYSKEIFDEDITVIVRPIKDRAKLAKEGYTLKVRLEKAPGDTSVTQMGMYINKWHSQQNLKKGAIRYTDLHTRGTTLYDVHSADDEDLASKKAKLNVEKIEIQSIKEIMAMENGTFDFNEEDGKSLIPVYGINGRVSTYRYMMNKRAKREYLKQDISAPAVLGRTLASIQDKVDTEEHNNKIFDIILEDMENYNDKTGTGKKIGEHHRYYKLEKDSPNPEIREIWEILPRQIKQKMRDEGLDYLAVRADLFKAYFGMREWGLFDLVGNIPLVGKTLVELTPQEIKYIVQIAGQIWINIVNMAKVNIIIKIPEVLVGNIISNIMIAVMRGHFNILKVAQLQLKGVTGLKNYLDITHELIMLENAKLAGNPNNLDISKISSLREDLKKHQVADLVDAGMFQAIVEEMSADEFKSSNRVARFFDNQLDKLPGYVKDGAHLLFLTEKTKYFKFMATATQFSDFASRYALYELEKEKQVTKLHQVMGSKKRIQIKDIPYLQEHTDKDKYVSKQEATELLLKYLKDMVLDVHINYSKLDGPIMDWLNRIGLAMFTKYAFRIQKPNVKMAIDHPLYYFSTIGLQFFTGNIDDISDAFGNHLSKFGNVSAFTGLVDDIPLLQTVSNVTR